MGAVNNMERVQITQPSKLKRMLNTLIRVSVVLAVLSSIALISVLVGATGNNLEFSQYFSKLLWINGVLAAALIIWIVSLFIRMYIHLKKGVFGARITAKFALAYAAMAIVPGTVIYVVSVQYMTSSVESWFNVRVETALESGLSIGQNLLATQLTELQNTANSMAVDLVDVDEKNILSALIRSRESRNASVDALIFSVPSNKILAFTGSDFETLLPPMPPVSVLNQLRFSREYARVEILNDKDSNQAIMQVRVIEPVLSHNLGRDSALGSASVETVWLQLTKVLPVALTKDLAQVQHGFRDYEELSLSRQGIRKLFAITLTFSLMLIVFIATLVAMSMARRFVKPLLSLAHGTHAVAKGHYQKIQPASSNDEVEQLTDDFNMMVKQLSETRTLLERNRNRLEESKVFLEGILDGLSSGVIVFDKEMRVTRHNQAASVILETDLNLVHNKRLSDLASLSEFAHDVHLAFAIHRADEQGRDYWQEQIELDAQESHGKVIKGRTLLIRGMQLLVHGNEHGFLLVFDDISDVIAANRVVAWGEVARRLAHEIKNPLMPILLASERIPMKLASKLEEADQEFLRRSISTIVNQVNSLKQMVNDFREYARLSKANFTDVDLNALIIDIASLYGWSPQGYPESEPRIYHIALDLDKQIPRVVADANQIRQVFNNILGNARDALQNVVLGESEVGITIRTTWLKSGTDQGVVRLVIEDLGEGFSQDLIESAFEPYVTSKTQGTGLGLAIVHKIIDEHEGKIELSNRSTRGARVTILFSKVLSPE